MTLTVNLQNISAWDDEYVQTTNKEVSPTLHRDGIIGNHYVQLWRHE